jgi:hypothetical protein
MASISLPIIDCDHYDGGRCRMGFYGGHPMAAQCLNNCGARTSRPGHVVWRLVDGRPQPVRRRLHDEAENGLVATGGRANGGFHKLATGAAGLAKSAIGINRAAAEVIASRRDECDACPHARVMLGAFQHCGLCGCLTAAKTTLANEKCPAGKW